MNGVGIVDKQMLKRDMVKKAVALAISGDWTEAVNVNQFIIGDCPHDIEAYNRLGKALSELGQNDEARRAFNTSLNIYPHNAIARKNIERLERLGQDSVSSLGNSELQVSLEEGGQTVITGLINLAPSSVILKLSPGNPVLFKCARNSVKVTLVNDEYVGQVEPKLASRLNKLITGGNRYQANVTSVSGEELALIIKEIFRHPSQSAMISFPSMISTKSSESLNEADISNIGNHQSPRENRPLVIKDWSDDDTEPGDDDEFSPAFDRIVSEDDDAVQSNENL